MPRDRIAVRCRLQQAALELYRERGFDQTTTAEIAARAGVTERTFFRHFTDKREVLFDGESALSKALVDAVVEAPKSLGPLETVLRAFGSVEQMFIDDRPVAEARQPIITASPALRERALTKIESLTVALAAALEERGVQGPIALFAAQAGMASFSYAAASWRDDPSSVLEKHLDRSLAVLRMLSSSRTRQTGKGPKKKATTRSRA